MAGVSKSGSLARGPPPPASNSQAPVTIPLTAGMSKAAIAQKAAEQGSAVPHVPTGGVSKSASAAAAQVSPPAMASTLRPDPAGGGLEDSVGGKAAGKGSMASGDGGAGKGTTSWNAVAETGNAAISKSGAVPGAVPSLPTPRGGLPWKHSVDTSKSAAAQAALISATTEAKSGGAPWRKTEEAVSKSGQTVSLPKKSSAPPALFQEDWKNTTIPKSGAVDALAQFGRQGDAQDGYREVAVVPPSVKEQAVSKAGDRVSGVSVLPPTWMAAKETKVPAPLPGPIQEKVAKAGATAKAQGADPPELLPTAKTLPWASKAGAPRGGIDVWDKAADPPAVSKPPGMQKAPPLPTPRGMRPAGLPGLPVANNSPFAEKEQAPEAATLPPKASRPALPRPLGKGGSAAKVSEIDEPTSKALPGGKGQAVFTNSKGK